MSDREQLEQLEKLAKEATPGPWAIKINHASASVSNGERFIAQTLIGKSDTRNAKQDAAYIAAASPDVILSLLASLKQKDEQIREARELLDHAGDRLEHVPGASSLVARMGAFVERNALPDTASETKEDGNG